MGDIFKTALAVIASLGGGGLLVVGLSSWLGRVWAERILASYKAEIDKELEKLKAENAKRLHVHNVQFDMELTAYREVWAPLVDAVAAAVNLRPIAEIIDPSMTIEEWNARKLQTFQEAGMKFISAARRNLPFFPEAIGTQIDDLLRIFNREVSAVRLGEASDRSYWDTAVENQRKVQEIADAVCQAIRERIGLIERLERQS